MSREPKIPEDRFFRAADVLALLAAVAALFFILTSGIPLIETHLLPAWGASKGPYGRSVQIPVLVFIALLLLVRWRLGPRFSRLRLVQWTERVIRLPWPVTGLALFILYAGTTSWVGWMRHMAFETRAFDLGIFAQAVWNTLQGDFLYSSLKGGICLLGDHASPILAALTPFYALWQDPRTLLLIQSLAAASCLFAVAYLAKQKIEWPGAPFIFMLLYFFYAPTRSALHEDFHPEVLAEPFLFLAFILPEKKKTFGFLLALLAAVSAKENMLGISFVFGVYALFFKKRPVLGLALMLASAGLFYLEIYKVIPFFSGRPYFYQAFYPSLFGKGGSPLFWKLMEPGSWEYVFKAFLSFLFLPFFHGATLLLAAPILFQNLLSSGGSMRSFNYHYTTGMSPFLFISTIYGFAELLRRFPFLKLKQGGLLAILLVTAILRSGPAEYYFAWSSRQNITPHTDQVRAWLKTIPPGMSVLTHNNLLPQVINRRDVYQFEYSATSKARQALQTKADYVAGDSRFWEEGSAGMAASLQELKAAGYEEVFNRDGFFLLKKNRVRALVPNPVPF